MRLKNLASDSSKVRVLCLMCGKMGDIRDMSADLDGPAFKAYFHTLTCVPAGEHDARTLYNAAALRTTNKREVQQ